MLKGVRTLGPLVLLATLLGLGLAAVGCDGDHSGDHGGPQVTPGVQIYELAVDERQGYAPMTVNFTVRCATDDPRADVEVFIDFGDGEDSQKTTRTGLSDDVTDESLLTQPEDREVTFRHTFDEPGEYTVRAWVVDVTNSTPEDDPDPVVIRSQVEMVDIDVQDLPDLIAVSVASEAREIDLHDVFTIDYQVLNNGSDLDKPFDMNVYLVKRPDMTIPELVDSTVAVKLTVVRSPANGLPRGATIDNTIDAQICDPRAAEGECDKISALVGNATWYPAVYIDPPNQARPELNITESSDTNNFRVASSGISITPLPELTDLKPEGIVANPVSTNILREVTVSFNVHNVGEVDAGPSRYGIYLSAGDNRLDPLDLQLGTGNAAPVLAGARQVIANLSYVLPAEIRTPGEYWVIVKADVDGGLSETNELNNIAVADRAITVLGEAPSQVDIVAENLVVAPPNTYLGGQLNVDFRVRNAGADDSGTYQCAIYLSSSDTLNLNTDTLLVLIGGDSMPADSAQDITRNLFVPDFIAPGSYRVFAICDPQNRIRESDETNNVAGPSGAIVINAEPQVDYTLRNVMVTPTTVQEGNALTFTAEVCNLDADYAGPVGVRAYLSADAVVDTTDTNVAAIVTTQSLGQGECEAITVVGTVNCLPFVDTYSVGLIVDATNFIIETDETNNGANAPDAVTITGGTGSFCTCVEDTTEGTGNNDTATAALITLTGAAPKTATVTGLSLCDAADFYRIDLDRGDDVSVTLTFDQTKGDLDLRVHDPNDAATPFVSAGTTGIESVNHKVISTNTNVLYVEVFPKQGGARNYYELSISATPSPLDPELKVTAINLTGGLRPSLLNPYPFEATIKNDGLNQADNFQVSAWLSKDTTLDATDKLVETKAITSLAPFATNTLSFVHTFDTATTSGTYYIIVEVDPTHVVTELDETNNRKVSASFQLDADCIPDSLEGANGNDSWANATVLRPAKTLQTWENLTVCNGGRSDYYMVCVRGGQAINHIGIVQQDLAYSSTMEIYVYDRDKIEIDGDYWSSYALISGGVEPYSCTSSTSCPTGETCVSGFCQDSRGEHCVYAVAALHTGATAVSDRYTLVVDAASDDNQAGEPGNDTETGAVPYTPATQWLTDGSTHAYPEDDSDWYYIDLKAGSTFEAVLRTADYYTRMYVYPTPTSTGTYVRGFEPKSITVTTDTRVTFEVYKSYPWLDQPTAYQIELRGLTGIDLVPKTLRSDIALVSINDAVLLSWDLANERLTDTNAPVEYRYLLSEDAVADASDIVLAELTTAGPDAFSSISVQDKVYLTIPSSVFGDRRIIVDVDYNQALDEASETNNAAAVLITVAHTCQPDDEEPNNDVASATAVLVPAQSQLWVPDLSICKADADFFATTIPAGSTYSFLVDGMVPFAWGDVDIFLWDDASMLLARSDGLNTASELITYTNTDTAPKTVTLEVRAFRATYSNVYGLTVTDTTP